MKGGPPMAKRIRHMGITMSKKEHDQFHKGIPVLSPKQHNALMKKLGVTKEQDEEWHLTHLTLEQLRSKGLKPINPFVVGGGFLAWCVKQGWLVQQGKEYFAAKDGLRQLRERFEINV
jgi:hypothetical protein